MTGLTVADIKDLGQDVAKEVDHFLRIHDDADAHALTRFSQLLDPAARTAVVKVLGGNGTWLTSLEEAATGNLLKARHRQLVEKAWKNGIVSSWERYGWRFFKLLRTIADRLPWHEFRPLANGALYQLKGEVSFRVAHLELILEHINGQRKIAPICKESDIQKKYLWRYEYDEDSRLMSYMAADKDAEQRRLFGRVRLELVDLDNVNMGKQKAINWCILSLMGSQLVLARKTATTREKLKEMLRGVNTTFGWESMVMPYRVPYREAVSDDSSLSFSDNSLWYVAYWHFKSKTWGLLSLSPSAPRPKDWKETEMHVVTKVEHELETTAFLAIACMKDILDDYARLLDMVNKVVELNWDVEATKTFIIASLT